jgi:hypothetical protein
VGFWERQTEIRNAMLKGEEAAAQNRPAPAAPVARDWFAAAEQQARKAETERLERDRKISEAHQARVQQQAEARQQAQRDWAMVRGQLREKVAEYRNAVSAAEAKTNSADDATAQAGILELAVAERRLAAAERDYAMHAARSPM